MSVIVAVVMRMVMRVIDAAGGRWRRLVEQFGEAELAEAIG
jgi:hypothetical protein